MSADTGTCGLKLNHQKNEKQWWAPAGLSHNVLVCTAYYHIMTDLPVGRALQSSAVPAPRCSRPHPLFLLGLWAPAVWMGRWCHWMQVVWISPRRYSQYLQVVLIIDLPVGTSSKVECNSTLTNVMSGGGHYNGAPPPPCKVLDLTLQCSSQ